MYLIRPGLEFPFSFKFTAWLSKAVSSRVNMSEHFSKKFGDDFKLGFRICAHDEFDHVRVYGPTVFKKDKSVEFSVFLPHHGRDYFNRDELVVVFDELMQSVVLILDRVGLDASGLCPDLPLLRAEFLTKPELVDTPEETQSP